MDGVRHLAPLCGLALATTQRLIPPSTIQKPGVPIAKIDVLSVIVHHPPRIATQPFRYLDPPIEL